MLWFFVMDCHEEDSGHKARIYWVCFLITIFGALHSLINCYGMIRTGGRMQLLEPIDVHG